MLRFFHLQTSLPDLTDRQDQDTLLAHLVIGLGAGSSIAHTLIGLPRMVTRRATAVVVSTLRTQRAILRENGL